MINYISTRSGAAARSFEEVLLSGLAPDGGLYVPEKLPQIDLTALQGKSYQQIAEAVMYPFVDGFITREEFCSIITDTYNEEIFQTDDIVPLVHLEQFGVHVMEQFHGPTLAFKDVALQLLGRLFDHALKKRNEHITIVGATSGDTGSAAIEGCRHSDYVNIFILHPKGRVSDVQRKQMTTVQAPNVHNIALDGSFDDCQTLVKAMFNDAEFREEINMSAVNSINWARIMAQIVYYFAAAIKLGAPEKDVSFVVPTGNFGNVLAAYYARKMGLPVKTLAIASNENDILTRFFESGDMKIGESFATHSPSMDIQISSNFERYLFDLLGRDPERLAIHMHEFSKTGKMSVNKTQLESAKNEFKAYRTDNDETLEAIKNCYEHADYILDPHTAVGFAAAKDISSVEEDSAVVLLATAHPAKFPDAVERAIAVRPELPDHLSDLFDREEFKTEQPNNLETVKDFVLSGIKKAGHG